MSNRDVSRFITLALDDAQLREKLESDAQAAFAGYDLTDDEKNAIRTRDEVRLRDAGVDAMTAHSWSTFGDVGTFAPDRPNVSGDLPPTNP